MADEETMQRVYEARGRYLDGLGAVDPLVLAPLVNPSFMGGPRWPDLRQAWRVIRRGAETIVVSDGLSDPFTDEETPGVGFGLEVLVHTTDPVEEPLAGEWVFGLCYRVSQQCAAHGGVRELIDELGVLSLEIAAPTGLSDLANEAGRVGVLLGLPAEEFPIEFELPTGSVRVVTAKALTPAELAFAVERGDEGRAELARRFAADGSRHKSSTARRSVV